MMLFKIYSRYVPNLTRQDGSAMERLLAAKLSQGPLATVNDANGAVMIPVDPLHSDAMRQPIPRPGNWSKSAVHWSKEEAAKAAAERLASEKLASEQAALPSAVDGSKSTGRNHGSQPPPLNWEALARNWLQEDLESIQVDSAS